MVEYMRAGTGHGPRDEDNTAVPALHPEVLLDTMSQDPHAPLHIVFVIPCAPKLHAHTADKTGEAAHTSAEAHR